MLPHFDVTLCVDEHLLQVSYFILCCVSKQRVGVYRLSVSHRILWLVLFFMLTKATYEYHPCGNDKHIHNDVIVWRIFDLKLLGCQKVLRTMWTNLQSGTDVVLLHLWHTHYMRQNKHTWTYLSLCTRVFLLSVIMHTMQKFLSNNNSFDLGHSWLVHAQRSEKDSGVPQTLYDCDVFAFTHPTNQTQNLGQQLHYNKSQIHQVNSELAL